MTVSHHPQTQAAGLATAQAPTQPTAETALARALEQSEAATDAVQQSADELLVINAVLKQEIPDDAQIGELAHALEKTDALEVRIQEAAQELTQVNEVLAQEIDHRVELEQELADTKAALVEARDQIA